MPEPDAVPPASLPAALAARARSTSDAGLAAMLGGGAVAALAALYWRPMLWLGATCIAAACAAFGAWGIADRELGERAAVAAATAVAARHTGWRTARAAAAALGIVAAAAFLCVALGFVLGTWIS